MFHDMHSLQESHGGLAALNWLRLPARRRDVKELGVSAADPFGDGVGDRDAPRDARASVKLTDSQVRNLATGWYVVRRPSVFHHRRSPLSFPNWEYRAYQFGKLDHAGALGTLQIKNSNNLSRIDE